MTEQKHKYKLHYFNIRGRAEVARLILAYKGIEYEDCRYSPEEWLKIKPGMPMNQMPVLEVDGVKFFQSMAINRFLAREYGLTPEDTMDEFYCDMFCESLDDIGRKYPSRDIDPEKKEQLIKEFLETTAPDMLEKLEKAVDNDTCLKGNFLGKKLSIAELYLMCFGDFLLPRNEHVFKKAPKLSALYKRIQALPELKAWLEKRPKTEY